MFPEQSLQLNEACAALGDNGAETVTKHVNKLFTKLLEIIERVRVFTHVAHVIPAQHGGDCVKFAGDALIILFAGQDTTKKQGGRTDFLRQATSSILGQQVRCALSVW